MSQQPRYRSGDLVIYTLSKMSRHPGPRARSIQPARLGDDYNYVVDKFWRVAGVLPNDQVVIVTRRGKTRTVDADDPLLKPAGWWTRWVNRNRFPDDEALGNAVAALEQRQQRVQEPVSPQSS